MKSPIVSVLTEAVFLAASHTLAARTFETFWKKVSPKLSEGVDYVDSHDGDVLHADKTFLEIITLRDAEITRIVNACLKDFMSGRITDAINQVNRIEERLTKRREQINAWKLALISAPASSLLPLKLTRRRLEGRIAREKKAIEADEATILKIKAEALAEFEKAGVPLTPEQMDGLLYSAEGTDVARVMAAADNIRSIEKKLAEQLANPDSTSAEAKTYTGFLMMCYRIYLEAVERALVAVDKTYLVKLKAVKESAGEQLLQADRLIGKAHKTSHAAKTNREINARTIEMAELYEAHLINRREELRHLREEMLVNFELAVNTFRTVKVGAELVEVMKTSENDLRSVFEFEAPQFSAFYDKNLRSEFDNLTRKLKS